MSLRKLVEGDCGGVNPLMQLGGQFTRDAARKDEGFARTPFEGSMQQEQRMVHDFLGQVAAPPQSFQMDTLLQEMREIEKANASEMSQLQHAPRVIDEMTGKWTNEFSQYQQQMRPPPLPNQMVRVQPQQMEMQHVREFFDTGNEISPLTQMNFARPAPAFLNIGGQTFQPPIDRFFEDGPIGSEQTAAVNSIEDWINDYQISKGENEQTASHNNEKYWQRLQDIWQKMSEFSENSWLSEYSETFDPYKDYEFAEENPMSELENALEKGKEYLTKGDIPSAVLCFEIATKKEPENAEAWELLGVSQAENEMDPQGIAALKRSLEINPENPRVLMALAVCYTNESLQSHALKMLTNWLQINPKYKHLIKIEPEVQTEAGVIPSSLIRGNKLVELQNLYLEAARLNPIQIDPEVQEALGVLYNLSAEFDKAVDCFQAALHANPQNAKVWNRLGASLANGSRSTEAVEAYQQALQLEPGFIRVRYNVGVCCMNLKAYRQAVQHLLTALTMQSNTAARREYPMGAAIGGGQQRMSESIWSTLKMIISLMGRSDLHGLVNDRNLDALNEAFKD